MPVIVLMPTPPTQGAYDGDTPCAFYSVHQNIRVKLAYVLKSVLIALASIKTGLNPLRGAFVPLLATPWP